MIKRTMQNHIGRTGQGFPVLTITGPRQSGKTTLAQALFPEYTYLDLEDPELRMIMQENPQALLRDPHGRYIIDEFQYVPAVLSMVKVMVDRAQMPHQFILTGSNQYVLMSGLAQSLAGRTAIFQLLPFSYSEAYKDRKELIDRVLYRGFYPRLIAQDMDPQAFYTGYVQTYLERDIRLLSKVHDLDLFHKFLGLCAGRSGSLLNKAALANEAGIDIKTVGNWLSLLQTSFIIFLLQPWHANLNKRLTKAPKLYFTDTGLVCRLLKVRGASDLENHPLKGQLFETLVVSEYLKYFYNMGIEAPLYFYRESNGTEVDLLIQHGDRLQPVEIKSAQTFHHHFLDNIRAFRKVTGSSDVATLVYGGDRCWQTDNSEIKPFYMPIQES